MDQTMLTGELVQELAELAVAARDRAYVPYSNFPVGAALLAKSGKIYTGCNIENASFGLTVCAERVAILKAISEGDADFEALAVATDAGVTPCGACRQVIAEFSLDMSVIVVDRYGVSSITGAASLLPDAFLSTDLVGDQD